MIFQRVKNTIAIFMLLFFLSSCVSVSASQGDNFTPEVQKAIRYLHTTQNQDGGFPYKIGQESSQSVTCWVIMGLAAAGEDIDDEEWAPGGKHPVDFLHSCQEDLNNTCDYARTLLALISVDQGTIYHGTDLVQSILSFQQEDGQFARVLQGERGFINSHMWSILALNAAGQEIPAKEKARQWLISRQNSDGGFGWCEGVPSDADDTAVAIQVLILLGEDPCDSEVIKDSLAYLKTCQGADGGFSSGYLAGDKSNSSSDAWVIQGLLAAGQSPAAEAWSVKGNNAVTHLLGLQDQSGLFYYMPGVVAGPIQTTATALMSLGRIPSPANQLSQPVPGSRTVLALLDVPKAYWAYQQITELVKADVLNGYPDGTFRPEKPVNRAEFATMMVKGMGLTIDANGGENGFLDVPEDFWASGYIKTCVKKGYVKGMPGGVFSPGQSITGAQLAAILVRTLPMETPAVGSGPYWYTELVKTADENGLLYPDFKPEAAANRAQCAYSIMKLRELLQVNGEVRQQNDQK